MAYPTVKLKRSSVIGRVPDSSQLAYGELAINYEDGKLYWKSASNIVKGLIIDSDQIDALNRVLFDQEFNSRSTDSLGEGSINKYYTFARSESDITDIVDSAYIQFLQLRYLDSAKAIDLIDSAYVQARQAFGAGIDSADIIQLIDSAYVNARLNRSLFLDSAEVIDLIDSAYIQSRQIKYDFLDSSEAIHLIDSAYIQARQIKYDFLDSAEAIDLIDSAYVNARLNRSLFLDSAEAIDLIDSAYVQARQVPVTTATVNAALATAVGTVTTGTWNGTVIDGQYGGTGVANTGKTITLGGSFTHTGAHTLGVTTTANTSITLPTTGTLATTSNKLSAFAATTSAELAGVISDETGSGALVFGTGPTVSLPVINNIKQGYSTTVTAAGTTTLTVNSNRVQFFTGTNTQVLSLPAPQTMTLGMEFLIVNNSTGSIEVRAANSATVITVLPGTVASCISIDLTAGNGAAGWNAEFVGFSGNTGTGNVVRATSPTLTTSFSLDSNVFFNQTYGLSINVDSDLGDSTQTSYMFGTKGLADSSVVIGLGRDGHFFNVIGTSGTLLRNKVVLGSQFSNTDFEIRNNLGAGPVNLNGGTLLFKVDSNGNASIPSATQSLSKTTGALVLVGGIGTQNNIYANEIYSSTLLSGATITGKYLGFDSDFGSKLTTNLAEGTNKYYTRVRFDSDFGSKSTTNLAEGTNKYYTTVRADSDAKRAISHSNVSGFGSISYTPTTGVISYTGPTTTDVRHAVSAGSGVNYDSTTGIFSLPQAVGTGDSVQFSGLSVSNNVVIDGNLFVFGTQTITSTASLSVSTPFIRVADSNTADVVDIGIIGQYSLDSGVTARFTGLIRDATNSEYYLFNNLVQNTLNDSNPPVTINVNGTGWQLSTLNVGTLKGKYNGFDSDARAFNKNFLVKTSNYTAVSGDKILANTGGGSFSITLPAGPAVGDNVAIYDINNWATNNLNVLKNGSTIEGYDSDFVLDIGQIKVDFIYGNSTWHIFASIGPEGPTGPTGPAGAQGESASTSLIAGLAIALS